MMSNPTRPPPALILTVGDHLDRLGHRGARAEKQRGPPSAPTAPVAVTCPVTAVAENTCGGSVPDHLKLWTIEREGAWDRALARGSLRADGRRVGPLFHPAYQWMTRQMGRRLSPPAFPASAPVWAWYQWHDARQRRPDLRSRGHLSPGAPGVLLEFTAPATDVILSDFQLWHFALNYWYLPTSGADRNQFDRYLKGAALITSVTSPCRTGRRTSGFCEAGRSSSTSITPFGATARRDGTRRSRRASGRSRSSGSPA